MEKHIRGNLNIRRRDEKGRFLPKNMCAPRGAPPGAPHGAPHGAPPGAPPGAPHGAPRGAPPGERESVTLSSLSREEEYKEFDDG